MVVRDTPEVMRLVEKLIASVDLPEPEVMLELEVMEMSTDRANALGLKFPDTVQYGLTGVTGQVDLSRRGSFTASVANPAVVASLRGVAGDVNILANPRIRVRNHEKAKVHIGEKLPVFTTTSSINVGVAASVSYLDVGLKLDVEPTIQLDNDVSIKVGLEVSNLISEVSGPNGSSAYRIGTRVTSTTLRLNDGETQVLAGLINDEDRRTANGIPVLSTLPVLGRLFGVTQDNHTKTEIVLLITPRIVRNLALPELSTTRMAGGTDASPGAYSSLLKANAKAGVGLAGAGAGAGAGRALGVVNAPAGNAAPAGATEAAPSEAVLRFEVTPQVAAGGTATVSLRNDSGATVRAEVEYDPAKLASAQGGPAGRQPVELPPRGERVVVLRALPAAAGQVISINVSGAQGTAANGDSVPVRLDGTGMLTVEAAR